MFFEVSLLSHCWDLTYSGIQYAQALIRQFSFLYGHWSSPSKYFKASTYWILYSHDDQLCFHLVQRRTSLVPECVHQEAVFHFAPEFCTPNNQLQKTICEWHIYAKYPLWHDYLQNQLHYVYRWIGLKWDSELICSLSHTDKDQIKWYRIFQKPCESTKLDLQQSSTEKLPTLSIKGWFISQFQPRLEFQSWWPKWDLWCDYVADTSLGWNQSLKLH